MAAAAHRGVLQYICSDAHKLALWLSLDFFFVNCSAYYQTDCVLLLHMNVSSVCIVFSLYCLLCLIWMVNLCGVHIGWAVVSSLRSGSRSADVGHALWVNLLKSSLSCPAASGSALRSNTLLWASRGLVIGVGIRMGNELWLARSLGRLNVLGLQSWVVNPPPHCPKWEQGTHSVDCLDWRLNSALTFQEDSHEIFMSSRLMVCYDRVMFFLDHSSAH